MPLNFRQFRQVGQEQWIVQPNLPRRSFIRLFGPLGVHARIRNTRIINAIRRLELPAEANILDAGCGHAYATFWLARHHSDYQFTALEIDPKLIEDGQTIADHLGLVNVRFLQGSVLDIQAKSTYDLIFSIDVLEHIEDDVEALRKFREALRPNGWLLLHLPRRHQEHKRFIQGFINHTTPDHVRDEYTANEISTRLAQANINLVYLHYGFNKWGELAFELNYLFWKWKVLRVLSALLFHPISVLFAYLDTRQDYEDGNSLLLLARR